MGLIAKLKELFSAKRYIIKAMEEQDRKNERFAAMTADELLALPDDDLCPAILYRIDKELDSTLGKRKKGTPAEWAQSLNHAKRVLYTLSYAEADIQNSGVLYFLVGNGGFARFVSDALHEIGAEEHQSLFDQFVTDSGLELSDLPDLSPENDPESQNAALYRKMEAFDRSYRALPALDIPFAHYIREHIAELAE